MSFFRALFGRPKDCDPYHNFTVDGEHPAMQRGGALNLASLRNSRVNHTKTASPSQQKKHNTKPSLLQVIKDEFQASIESLAEPETHTPTLVPTHQVKTRLSSRVAELRREIAQKNANPLQK